MGGDTISSSVDDQDERRMTHDYTEVLKNYDELNHRVVNMEVAKTKVLSYTPGSWIENVGGKTMSDYNVPKTTTLLLIGPKGSGKSSLVNRISRVFEDDKFAPERAQVTYNSRGGNGTFFLQEYMIPRSSTSFCLYDTRSFSSDLSENLEMIKCWMTKGVSHGEFVKRASDSSSLQARMKREMRQNELGGYERRMVNFVIFVVNGLSVLKCLESYGADTQYTQMVVELFSSPFLSFKDHKPAIAITHGDVLSLSERARVRVYLGELLGVHPSKQTFDVPDNCEQTTDLTIVDMVRYALEHADRNLPCKGIPTIKEGLCDRRGTSQEVKAKTQMQQEGALRREYDLAQKQWKSNQGLDSRTNVSLTSLKSQQFNKNSWGWSWSWSWMSANPWEIRLMEQGQEKVVTFQFYL